MRKISLSKHYRIEIFLEIAPYVLLAIWFGLKCLQLQSPYQIFSDAHISHQLSKGWLEGKPLLYDSYYGYHGRIHNYFFILLLGPITWLVGIYGLFLVYILLTAYLFRRLWKVIADWSNRKSVWLSLILYGLGPLAYLIFIDVFGWHPEQYFFPLMGLSALYLAQRKYVKAALCLFLVALVKETSPVLICGLLLFASITSDVLNKKELTLKAVLFSKRNLTIGVLCAGAFLVGILWLSYLNPYGSRLSQALTHLWVADSTTLFFFTVRYLIGASVLFVVLFLPFIPLLKPLPGSKWMAGFLCFYFLVMCIAFFVESLHYFPGFDGGLPYPTRVGSVLSVFFGCYIFLFLRFETHKQPISLYPSLWSIILQLTFSSLLVFHSWPFIETRNDLEKSLRHLLSGLQGDMYGDPDRQLLQKFAAQLPRGSEVVAPDRYLSIFHKFYGSLPGRSEHHLGQPILYVCESDTLSPGYIPCPVSEPQYHLYKGKNILIWIDKRWKNQFEILVE